MSNDKVIDISNTSQIISSSLTDTLDFDPNSDPLNKYLYDGDEEKDDDFFDVGRDNFFSTLAFAMEGGGDFFTEETSSIVVENDPYAFYEPMFE